MNICLLNDSFPPFIDGVSNTVVNYAENLKKHGHTPVVVTPKCPDADDSVFSYPVLRYPGIDVRDRVGYIAGYPFSPKIEGQLKESGIQLLHSHCPISSTIFARSVKERLDAPLVMTYHTKFDIEIAKAFRTRPMQVGAARALIDNISACSEVWTVSRGAGENLKALGYQGDYVVMENGVDIPRRRLPEDDCRRLTAGYDLPANVPLYLFVGRMEWYKGIRIILDALAALKAQDFDFRMVFIGKGTEFEEIRACSSTLGLDGRVFFTGPVYDREVLCAWYCRADLFLFPSTFDTNGLVVREAAACSLPAVLIKNSCAAEGITHMQNGYLIEENAASMALMLYRLGCDRKTLRGCGERAAQQLYISWEDSVKKAEERYAIVIDEHKRTGGKKIARPSDEFFALQGDLMDALSEIRSRGDGLIRRLDRYL
ncbi:MAG: glycosyltransferase [Firmicutes bacterium]|nr:glycosyltransferase [Bacillota bacterium]